MPNWVLATVEFPADKIGYVFNDESTFFLNEYGNYENYYNNDTNTYMGYQSISKVNPLYIVNKKGAYYNIYGSRISSYVATSPLYNDNGHITFDIDPNCLTDGYIIKKCVIPEDYDQEWGFIDAGYTTQNIDTDYEKITCDFKWSGIINDEVLNEIVQKNINRQFLEIEDPDYYYTPVYFGCWYAGIEFTHDDILEYTSGTNFLNEFYDNSIVYENTDGTENIFIIMDSYNYVFEFPDDYIYVSSMFFYNRHEDKWYYYLLWNDKNGNTYYYDATDCYKNKTWLHAEYTRYQNEGTLKLGERTFTFPIEKGTVKLRFYAFLMPVFDHYNPWNSDENTYEIYGYTQIANIKSYVVPLEEDLDFGTPMVYVKNSNYRDNFFLSVEVENDDPNGYEVLWDNGARTVSIPCRFGEYHEVTVTNRAGSTKAWNVAGFGDARFYKYRVNVADLISVSDIGKSSSGTINLTNNAEYATQTDCTPSFTCGSSSYTAEVKVVDGHVTIDTTGTALRTSGYYAIRISRYNQYNTQANGVGFGLSWKMKLLGDIGEWIQYSYECKPGYDSVSLSLDWDVYGNLISGINLSVVKSHGELKCVAYSVSNSSVRSIMPDDFMNGEWVDCYFYKYDTNKYFFNVNGYTILNFEDSSLNVETLYLYNTSLAGSMSSLILNEKTPRVIHSEIKRSMGLIK